MSEFNTYLVLGIVLVVAVFFTVAVVIAERGREKTWREPYSKAQVASLLHVASNRARYARGLLRQDEFEYLFQRGLIEPDGGITVKGQKMLARLERADV